VLEGVMNMPWQQKISYLIGQPVGILINEWTSDIRCFVWCTSDEKLLVIEYMYQAQFALKQYGFYMNKDINAFPPCQNTQPLN
jgi:hypothetical protein